MKRCSGVNDLVAQQILIEGSAEGALLVLEEPISFWGGVDVCSGKIVDHNHPQMGESIAGKVLVLPGTRGSTASPGALLEALAAGVGPAAIILTEPDNVCLVAASMCSAIGANEIPVLRMMSASSLSPFNGKHCCVGSGLIRFG